MPPAVSVAPRITTSTTSPSCVSICVLDESKPKPNLVDSSQPNEMMRLQRATRKAAMASEATVSSARIFWISRSSGTERLASEAYAEMASKRLAPTALGATRRDNCAQMSTRSFCGMAL